MLGLLLLVAVFAIVIACVVVVLCTSAVIFARAAFALLVAGALTSSGVVLVPNSEFLNYVAWAILTFGAVYLLSTLPRVDIALNFFCTIFMSVLIIFIGVMLVGSIATAGAEEPFKLTLLYEIIVKVVCVLIAIGAVIMQTKKASYDAPKNKFMQIVERLVAAVLYGGAITFLSASINGNWKIPDAVAIIVMVVSSVAAFFVDNYLQGKELFPASDQEVV